VNRLHKLTLFMLASAASFELSLSGCSSDDTVLGDILEADGSRLVDGAVASEDARVPDDASDGRDADASDARDAALDIDAASEPVVCATQPCATQLVAGDKYFCALLSDHTARCWGYGWLGALGGGELTLPDALNLPPAPVEDLTNATQLSAAGGTTCARTDEGRVRCWGSNDTGQLGLQASPVITDWAKHWVPSDVDLSVDATRVDVTPYSVCATTNAGVYCWGQNQHLQLARANAGATDGPGLADLHGYDVESVAGGLYNVGRGYNTGSLFGLTRDRKIVGWGIVSGRPSSLRMSAVPVPLPVHDVTGIAAGSYHACAVAGGSVYCWGSNETGALGTGIPGQAEFPTLPARAVLAVTESTAVPQQVAVSSVASCVRMTDGSIQCSGEDRFGQLGRGAPGSLAPNFGPATAFTQRAVQVAMSDIATCALVQGGTVHCWGGNKNGELGQGTRDSEPHPSPVRIVFP